MSLESILEERIQEAEGLLASKLELSDNEKAALSKTKPKIIIEDKLGIYAGYNILNNVYIFSKNAINNFIAIGEEVAHSIRLRLNSAARNYLLNPFNRAKENIKDYIKAINLEEYFGRYGALVYANHKGQTNHNSLWSRISNHFVESFSKSFDYITHFFGYKKAEKDYEIKGATGLKEALYNNDASKIGIPAY